MPGVGEAGGSNPQIVGPEIDSDGDGMPDSWESLYNLQPGDPGDAALDADLDGMTNLAEYLSGTNPRDPNSALKFDSVVSASGAVLLRFSAVAGKSYTVQYKPHLSTALWEKLADVPAGPDRAVETADDSLGEFSARYYRLVTPALP